MLNGRSKGWELILHYDKFIKGEPTGAYKLNNLPSYALNPVYVLEFTLSVLGVPGIMYATVGASHQAKADSTKLTDEKSEPHVATEIIAYARESNKELAKFVANLALYPLKHNTFFDFNHKIRLSEGSRFVNGSSLTAGLFTYPFLEKNHKELNSIGYKDGSHAHILWCIPLYQSESDFLKYYGNKALFDLFINESTDLADLWRLPVSLPTS